MDNRKTSANSQKSGQNSQNPKESYGENRTGTRSTNKTTGSTNGMNTRSTNCGRDK